MPLGSTSEANPTLSRQPEYIPAPEALQFRKAEHVSEAPTGPPCVICAKPIGETYFHANGKTVCPTCAKAVEAGTSAPPHHTLLKAFFYGLGTAIVGSLLWATITIVTNYQLSLIAILIGFMVGKSVRYASQGLGGRPQQILAVVLTYFSITTSVIPVVIYQQMEKPKTVQTDGATAQGTQPNVQGSSPTTKENGPPMSLGAALLMFLGLALASPFMSLSAGASGILTLVIIFFGLQRAWRMTGRANVVLMGPYQQGS